MIAQAVSRMSSDITKAMWLLCTICPYLTSFVSLWEALKLGGCIWAFSEMPHKWNWAESHLPPGLLWHCHLLSFGTPLTAVPWLVVQAGCCPTPAWLEKCFLLWRASKAMWTRCQAICSRWPFLYPKLDQMASKCPFPVQPFHDPVKSPELLLLDAEEAMGCLRRHRGWTSTSPRIALLMGETCRHQCDPCGAAQGWEMSIARAPHPVRASAHGLGINPLDTVVSHFHLQVWFDTAAKMSCVTPVSIGAVYMRMG